MLNGPAADAERLYDKLHFGRGKRLPMIRQSEAGECGLACLAMIASFYGRKEDLAQLRLRFSTTLKGMHLGSLIEVAQVLGLACRPLRLDVDELRQLATPCILHWDLDHFVVLRRVGRRSVVIHDPAVGERTLTWAQLSKHFTGIAVELSKGPTFQRKLPPPPISLKVLAGSIQGLGSALLTIFGLALVLEFFALLAPQFLQIVVDQVLADGDHDLLVVIGLSFCVLLVLQVVISGLRTWTVMWLSSHFNLSWTGNLFQHLLRLPESYFMKRHLGDIVSRFGAVGTIQQTITTQFVSVIVDGMMSVLTLGVMLAYSPILTVIVASSLVVYALLRILYYRVYRESNLSQITVTAAQQSRFLESIRGVQMLRLYNQTGAQTSRYLNSVADTVNTTIAVQKLNMLFGGLNTLSTGVQRIAVLWLGAWFALKGELTAGMLMAFASYADQFAGRATGLIDYLVQLRLLRLQAERLADIALSAPEPFTQGTFVGEIADKTIRFDKVSFRYGDSEPWVVRDCSFEVKPRESVALMGPSGCGKSTIVKLMLGLLDPQQGSISIGGVDLKHLGKAAYRRMVTAVMQDDVLLAGSIAENISLFDQDASIAAIEEAAKKAQIHQDISAMPMGYLTPVGDMGAALSGGQRQRIHLARALYRTPEILVLDEATSHVDAACETRLFKALDETACTRIFVAHRSEMLKGIDAVLLCLNGQVARVPGAVEASEPGDNPEHRLRQDPVSYST